MLHSRDPIGRTSPSSVQTYPDDQALVWTSSYEARWKLGEPGSAEPSICVTAIYGLPRADEIVRRLCVVADVLLARRGEAYDLGDFSVRQLARR